MPRIAEIKEIDGAIWCKVDVDLKKDEGPIGLYTPAEVAHIRKDERLACIAELEGAYAECETLNLLHGAARIRAMQ